MWTEPHDGGSPAFSMMPINPFPARATEEISDEKRCRFTNAHDVTQPFLRQEIRRFVVIRSDTAGEVRNGRKYHR